MTRLGTLIERLRAAGLLLTAPGSFDDALIDHLTGDSRRVGPQGLFVAIRGVEADGHLFIDKAVKNGAIAIVCEAMPANREERYPGIAFVHVSSSRAALAELGASYYGDPSRALCMLAVTGTNGKTTVSFLMHHVLMRTGERTGLIGTVEVRIGDEIRPAELTTPDPLDIQRLLRQMVDAGCGTCAMEVSSHALDQERVRSVTFDAAVFTNLTRDHLDYHGTHEAYLAAKKRLFDGLTADAVAVYNADDPAGLRMVADSPAARRSYAIDAPADVQAEIVEDSMDGLELRWAGRDRRFHLVGRFNAYNLLAAYAALTAVGHDSEAVLDALQHAPPVPGRFEVIRFEDGTRVVVDYAHTPDALENVLRTIVATKADDARLWCVFGCGGDRDREKRPMMAAVAERYADRLIVTSDNPRTEDPLRILNDIRAGLRDAQRARFIVDRREAIAESAQAAEPGDVVLIAGKGHEPYQIVGTEKRPFDDREVARHAFASRVLVIPSGSTTG